MNFFAKCSFLFIFFVSFVAVNSQLKNNDNVVSVSRARENKNEHQDVPDTYKHKQKKHVQRQEELFQQEPPPINKYALMARYIVNQADWSPVATISSQKNVKSYPFVNVISISDGVKNNGSGIPYLFLTPLDFTAQDVFKDSRATLLMTLAQGDYCKSKDYDPMDPRCARVMLSGKIKAVKNNTAEHKFAKQAMFGRHPWLAYMPEDHQFFFAKLKIFSIVLLDTFGGPKHISLEDYLHPPTTDISSEFLRWYQSSFMQEDSENEGVLKEGENRDNILPSVLLT